MNNEKNIVTQISMTNLWTDNENVLVKREKYLTMDNVQEMLKKHVVEFVVASVGEKLTWISSDKSFDFWKTELKPHLAGDINRIDLEKFPNNYAYVASEWAGEIQTSIILLEKYH